MEKWVTIIVFAILFVMAATVGFAFWRATKLRDRIFKGMWISHKDFVRNWGGTRNKGFPGLGYSSMNVCGCYVIAVYGKSVPESMGLYDTLHIGHYPNVCQRVHDIFMGKAKPEVIDAIRKGRQVFVQLIPCDSKRMDKIEKQLRAALMLPTKERKQRHKMLEKKQAGRSA